MKFRQVYVRGVPYPNCLVSDTGEVRVNGVTKKHHIDSSTHPYLRVQIPCLKDGHSYRHNVALLVAEAFVPNPNGYRFVCYKDGDRLNVNASNLQWTDHPNKVLDNQTIHRVCRLIQSGAKLKTVAAFSGVPYNVVVEIANGTRYKSVSSKYNFPK